MSMLAHHRVFFRCVSLLTIISFLPSSVQAWYFLPQAQAVVMAADEGPVPLPAKKLEHLAANTDGTVAPLPLSEDKKKQLVEGSVAPTRVAQAEAAATRLGLGAVSTAKKPTPKVSDQKTGEPADKDSDASASTWSGFAPTNLLAHIENTQAKATASAPPEEKLLLAQTNTPSLAVAALQVAEGQVDLSQRLAEADALRDADALSNAYNAYILLADDYPQRSLPEVQSALTHMKTMLKNATLQEIEAIIADGPSFESLQTAFAKVHGQGLVSRRAALRVESGDEAGAQEDYRTLQSYAWRIMEDHPNDVNSRKAVLGFLNASEKLGEAEVAQQQVMAYGASSPLSVATFSIWNHLREKAAKAQNTPNAVLWHTNMLDAYKEGVLDGILADPTVNRSTKLNLELAIAYGNLVLGHLEEAQTRYRSIQDRFSPIPDGRVGGQDGVYSAALQDAIITTLLSPGDPYQGILAYYDCLQRFPESPKKANALMGIAELYLLSSDYEQAVDFYAQAAQTTPETEASITAADELDYVFDNLYQSVEVASNKPVGDRQWCGPLALQELLKREGIDTAAAELATLAKTDSEGTTMQGLIEAAGVHGLSLAGVLADDIRQVPLPCIAYLGPNHFVMVRSLHGDMLAISDNGKTPTLVPIPEFITYWDGKALVAQEKAQLAMLSPEVLRKTKGGGGWIPAPPPPPPPCVPTATKS